MPRYVIGANEVQVNQSTAEQVAPAGTLSPADAAKKDALKEENARRAAGGFGLSTSHIVAGLFIVGLGVVAVREAKAKKKKSSSGSAGHVIR